MKRNSVIGVENQNSHNLVIQQKFRKINELPTTLHQVENPYSTISNVTQKMFTGAVSGLQ